MISSLEIARRCGVSQGTVDRALHNRGGINPDTRARILKIAEQHGYVPHPAVRELLTGHSTMVGALVPSLNNLFFMDLLAEMARSLDRRGLRLQIAPVANETAFLETLEDFAARRHRLILAIPPKEGLRVPAALAKKQAILSLVSPCEGAAFLSPDEEFTGRQAVRYLHGKGHQKILHLTYRRGAHAIAARRRGYEQECEALGLPSQSLVADESRRLDEVLESWQPTALFCHNDWLATEVVLRLARTGRNVPEDLSVLGVDNGPTLMAIHPGLTTMAYPVAALCESLNAFLDGESIPEKLAPLTIVERRSVRDFPYTQPA